MSQWSDERTLAQPTRNLLLRLRRPEPFDLLDQLIELRKLFVCHLDLLDLFAERRQ